MPHAQFFVSNISRFFSIELLEVVIMTRIEKRLFQLMCLKGSFVRTAVFSKCLPPLNWSLRSELFALLPAGHIAV